ncbi:ion transporter [Flavobacterium sp. RHBU_24]|uniref:ion transporter n=1 Tax=Flavobacterium sp. RHBU_24 TaxID=3391185 RepID=UPI00398523B4
MDTPEPINRGLLPEKQRHRLHTIIYEADTAAGKTFDIILLIVILLSIVAIMLETVTSVMVQYGSALSVIEWIITIFFTLEYIARIASVKQPLKYIFSFYGIIDLLATLPMNIGFIFPGYGYRFLISIRAIRLLRVFRILHLTRFIGAANQLTAALKKSREKIAVFLYSVMVICIILGTLMYVIEGPESGFTSIPTSIYWTIVTLTTVGFGDITPITPLGQFVSVIIMIMGYGIIAVPTGLVTAQILNDKTQLNTQVCPNCTANKHRDDARFCYNCAAPLKTNADA